MERTSALQKFSSDVFAFFIVLAQPPSCAAPPLTPLTSQLTEQSTTQKEIMDGDQEIWDLSLCHIFLNCE